MYLKPFLDTILTQWDHIDNPTFPKDRKLQWITERFQGMATENTGYLLNHAVSFMEPGECYLEVGTWKGRTLRYAMEGHQEKEFFAVDNFSDFTKPPRWYRPFSKPEPQRSLDRMLREAQKTYRVTFMEGDFRKLLPTFHRNIGVYFYDGGHTYRDQYDGLDLALPHLAPQSLIVVDDTNPFEEGVNGSEARVANRDWLAKHSEWKLLYDFLSPKRDFGWHNGIQIIGRFNS